MLIPLIGPGYFVAYEQNGEVVFDYTRLPPTQPVGWPRRRSNNYLLSFFVYRNMVDILRGITPEITIGRATRRGKPIDAWFVLCRVP